MLERRQAVKTTCFQELLFARARVSLSERICWGEEEILFVQQLLFTS